ncbi:MAG TPA: precorrin-6y C5,15-methyltransferase (decarboxylating) subunit CbiE [Baekduia sp.]|uniref:precorrin-6y C5,15-methyltransferase (decarboxylating) subunit CbiE n=1 Tax=Baekduia sp. TaxID=2600305 RepID=UPI002BA009A8|nr:precorrin-6y C5,15-methyltransferase (decarboxylating) subunit CbiE [Baekduia sp.]HMJ33424.1 precorrin-6y C5,15-methyltransferase (decarboxylating) subunit CbiE [Baekduia sp.]
MSESVRPGTATVAVLGVHGGRVPPGTEELLAGAALVAGGARQVAALAPAGARTLRVGAGPDDVLAAVAADDGPAVVLASGDPGFFGIVRALRRSVPPERLLVHPAPSSVAVAFARIGLPWDDALLVSAHARDPRPALHTALRHPKVAILTGPDAPPAWFAERLRGSGRTLVVAERLGEADERVVTGAPEELARAAFAEPNVVISLGPEAPAASTPSSWALPESAFDHRAGMITKREVRALALAHLGPRTGDLVWDVGCGSGSVAVECARLGAAAIAIDDDPDAIGRTARNAGAHGVPLQTVEGHAPAALADLPDPDAAFVGGGGADLDAIVDRCAARSRRAVVVTLALIERAGPVVERLAAAGLETEATMMQSSRLLPLAGGHRLAATNPVIVVVGRRA